MLPHQELSRLAGDWYQACADAMLRGNYAPIDNWIRAQSRLAMAQGFAVEDISRLLLICRCTAIETESWDEDIFSGVDEVMQEVVGSTRRPIPPGNADVAQGYGNGAANRVDTDTRAGAEGRTGDRRKFGRNRLRFPIRVRGTGAQRDVEEFNQTRSVLARRPLLCDRTGEYKNQQVLKISFPYWNEPGGISLEYPSKVVRQLTALKDGKWGVGVWTSKRTLLPEWLTKNIPLQRLPLYRALRAAPLPIGSQHVFQTCTRVRSNPPV